MHSNGHVRFGGRAGETGREQFRYCAPARPYCHFRARMSGRLWEQRRVVRYYLHRWPSQQAMNRLRDKVRARTGRNRAGADIREVIADLNPLLRGSPGAASLLHDVA